MKSEWQRIFPEIQTSKRNNESLMCARKVYVYTYHFGWNQSNPIRDYQPYFRDLNDSSRVCIAATVASQAFVFLVINYTARNDYCRLSYYYHDHYVHCYHGYYITNTLTVAPPTWDPNLLQWWSAVPIMDDFPTNLTPIGGWVVGSVSGGWFGGSCLIGVPWSYRWSVARSVARRLVAWSVAGCWLGGPWPDTDLSFF